MTRAPDRDGNQTGRKAGLRLMVNFVLHCALLCILTLVCTGCPQRYVTRTVTVAGVTGDAEVQRALKLIDGVVTSHGFTATEDPNLKVPGALVTYGALFPSISVSLREETLEFDVANRPDLTLEDKQLLKAVKTELKSHFDGRVKSH